MKDLTPNDYKVIAFKDKILTFDAESDPSNGFGSRVGGLGGTQTQAVSKAINDAGNLITDIINARLDTEAKTILDSFSFGVSGAIQIGTYVNGVTGDIKISPSGIIARNTSGANTITVNGTTGDVTLIGTITASAGSIGGWVVQPTYLYYDGATDATSAGMASLDYPFYAGAKYANRATAPFRVTPAGALTASSATITGALTTAAGSSINGTYLTSASVTGTAIASATITATNIVNATITATQIANNTITATQIANSTITASQIAALTITAAEIANLTITSGKINDVAVDKLTAGTITSKAVTLAVSDGTGDVYFNAGKTDFDNTQSGFILGIDDSDGNKAKFYIGSSTSYFNWDGSAATFSGTLSAASGTLGAISIGTNAWNVDSSGNMWWGNTGGGFSGAFNGIDSNGATTLESLNTHAHLGLKYSFTAGENLTATNAVRLGYSTAIEHTYAKDTTDTTSWQIAQVNGLVINVKYTAQAVRFSSVETIKAVTLNSAFDTGGNYKKPSVKVGIMADSGGNPSGTFLADTGYTEFGTGNVAGVKTWTLTSPYTTTANTTYWIVLAIEESGTPGVYVVGSGTDNGTASMNLRYDNAYNYSSTYVMKYKNTDADSWTDGGVLRNLYFSVVINETVGSLYKADATTQAIADHYLGFVESTITAGTTGNVKIATQGIYNRGSLTAGSVYYLSDTAGAIGTSAGTISKKLGIALSTTNLYLY